ncbi:MAG: flagellar basal body rod protein FlgB [Synergistales bacterium]
MSGDPLWEVQKLAAGALSRRFSAISENLANINTPGYARREVLFEEALRKAAGSDRDEGRLPLAKSGETQDGSAPAEDGLRSFSVAETRVFDEEVRLDGNNVDPEIEMAKLAETRMAYGATMRLMARRVELMRIAMGGR